MSIEDEDEFLSDARNALQNDDLENAKKIYRDIVKSTPAHPEANHQLGTLTVKSGNKKQALNFFKTALTANPKVTQYWASYISALIDIGRSKDAKAVLKQFRSKGGNDAICRELEQRINPLQNDPTPEQLQPLINLHNQGHHQKALNDLEGLSQHFPSSEIVYNMMGILNGEIGRSNKAMENFKTGLKINPKSALIYLNLGNLLSKTHNEDDAIRNYKSAIKIQPNFTDAYFNLGNAYREKGNLKKAQKSYKKALRIDSNHYESHIHLGLLSLSGNEFNSAIESFSRALLIKPDSVEALYNKAQAYSSKGDSRFAIDHYQRALQINKDYAEAWIGLGNTEALAGDLDSAVARFKNAIRIDPHNKLPYLLIGKSELEQGKPDNAYSSFKKALAIDPDCAQAHWRLGSLALNRKNYEEAESHFQGLDYHDSATKLLECFYRSSQKSKFHKQLDYCVESGENNAVIGSLVCQTNLQHDSKILNPFCNNPLAYFSEIELPKKYDFEGIFRKNSLNFLRKQDLQFKSQGLLQNGIQTAGNCFADIYGDFTGEIKKIIFLEIERYRDSFKASKEGLIKNWPSNYDINGWFISMRSGGELQPHIHETGWLSGSIYINVPKRTKADEGNLVISTTEDADEKPGTEGISKSITVVTGSLCLFPASLYHHTIPFSSDEERVVLAFDVMTRQA